jgi:hypothetical protein
LHQLIAAFFAMIFSFGHAQTVHHSEFVAATDNQPYVQAPAPTREQLAYQEFQTATSYAETSCVSCRQMNVVYDAR